MFMGQEGDCIMPIPCEVLSPLNQPESRVFLETLYPILFPGSQPLRNIHAKQKFRAWLIPIHSLE